MKRLALAFALCLPLAALAGGKDKHTGKDKTCGESVAEEAKYPRQLGELLTAVADNFEAHAKWMTDSKDPAAKRERDEFVKIARAQRELAKSARDLATRMERARDIPEAQHDLSTMPAAMMETSKKAIEEQKEFAALLHSGVREQEAMMRELQGVGGSGSENSGPEPMRPEVQP